MFYLSITYSETTPESAEQGDFSDTGLLCEGENYTLSEMRDLLHSNGYHAYGSEWLSTGFYTTDYATGTERELNLHIDRDKSSARAVQIWDSLISV